VFFKDFDFKLNKSRLFEKSGTESLNTILFDRNSVFTINIIKELNPTKLARVFITRSDLNEEYLDSV